MIESWPGGGGGGVFPSECPQEHTACTDLLCRSGEGRGRLIIVCGAPRPTAWQGNKNCWCLNCYYNEKLFERQIRWGKKLKISRGIPEKKNTPKCVFKIKLTWTVSVGSICLKRTSQMSRQPFCFVVKNTPGREGLQQPSVRKDVPFLKWKTKNPKSERNITIYDRISTANKPSTAMQLRFLHYLATLIEWFDFSQWGLCIMPWYPKFNGSHFGLSSSSIHRIDWDEWQIHVNYYPGQKKKKKTAT